MTLFPAIDILYNILNRNYVSLSDRLIAFIDLSIMDER